MKRILFALLFPVFWACEKDKLSTEIKYEVQCDSCEIVYDKDGSGHEEKKYNVIGDWSHIYNTDAPYTFLTVINRKDNGDLSAKIYVDGQVVASDELNNVDAGYIIELEKVIQH